MSVEDSTSTGSTRPTWAIFLSDFSVSETGAAVHNEETFHRKFMSVCIQARERDPQRLLGKFLRYHDQPMTFTRDLDELAGPDPSKRPSRIFWSKAFETVVAAFGAQQTDTLFHDFLSELSNVIPPFDTPVSRFPHNEIVQKPLQKIFATYIQCYEMILQHFLSSETDLELDAFHERVKSASQEIATYKEEWEEAVNEASADQEAARGTSSALSSYDGTLGLLNPYIARPSFEWQEPLGQGTYGQVYKVREASTGTFYAQKVIRITEERSRSQIEQQVSNEVLIMQKLRHHHIASVQFHVFDDDACSILMLPVADLDLGRFLTRCIEDEFPRTELADLTYWFGCLVNALTFAHSENVKHEDIKPSNILVKGHTIYLADFGSAKDFSECDSSITSDLNTFGTLLYLAPEGQPRGRSADVFSLGCVFTQMLTVRHKRTLEDYRAFRDDHRPGQGVAFRDSPDEVVGWLDETVDPEDPVGSLIKEETFKMLHHNPAERIKAKAIKRNLRVESDDVFCSICS